MALTSATTCAGSTAALNDEVTKFTTGELFFGAVYQPPSNGAIEILTSPGSVVVKQRNEQVAFDVTVSYVSNLHTTTNLLLRVRETTTGAGGLVFAATTPSSAVGTLLDVPPAATNATVTVVLGSWVQAPTVHLTVEVFLTDDGWAGGDCGDCG